MRRNEERCERREREDGVQIVVRGGAEWQAGRAGGREGGREGESKLVAMVALVRKEARTTTTTVRCGQKLSLAARSTERIAGSLLSSVTLLYSTPEGRLKFPRPNSEAISLSPLDFYLSPKKQ